MKSFLLLMVYLIFDRFLISHTNEYDKIGDAGFVRLPYYCALFCPYGYKTDKDGNLLCRCKSDPLLELTPSAPSTSTKSYINDNSIKNSQKVVRNGQTVNKLNGRGLFQYLLNHYVILVIAYKVYAYINR